MTTVTLEPHYIPLIQKPMCCSVTCLQMILHRNGFGLFDQERLAIEFGVRISTDYINAFSEQMPTMTQINDDEGISTVESADLINSFLIKNAPGLHAKSFVYSIINEDIPSFIASNIKLNNDIWIEYHGHEIHATDQYSGNYVHDGLIESIDVEKGLYTIIDPVPEHKQRITVHNNELISSISTKFGRETGFVIISNSNR